MTSSELALRSRQLLELCQRLHGRNMLAAADGNLSFKLNDNLILITPSGQAKAFMHPDDMALMDLEGRALKGHPSTEKLMHLQIYKSCPKARAVVHAHPVTATAWSIAKPEMQQLPAEALSEVILATGGIPIAPYARPGTQAMGDVLKSYLPRFRAIILRRHGAITWGENLDEAYRGMERIEHSAQVLMAAHQLGGITQLPEDEVQHLHEMRKQIGEVLL